MEIDVTDYVLGTEHADISASIAEKGQNAARLTWDVAKAETAARPLLKTPAEVESAADWLAGFGADWNLSDPAGVQALFAQFVSGDVREAQSLHYAEDQPGEIDWPEYRKDQEEGRCSGYLFLGAGDRIYFQIG